jgi:hypothetical protein
MVNAAWIIYGALSTLRMATVNDFPLGWQELCCWFLASVLLAIWAILAHRREREQFQRQNDETKAQLKKFEGAMIGLGIAGNRTLEVLAKETADQKRQDAVHALEAKIAQLRELLPPTVKILSPKEADSVGLKELVTGRVDPRSAKIQVLVMSRDNKYYVQEPLKMDGERWSVACQFGNDKSPSKSKFQIVVVSGSRVEPGPQSQLPDGVHVRVRRTVFRK